MQGYCSESTREHHHVPILISHRKISLTVCPIVRLNEDFNMSSYSSGIEFVHLIHHEVQVGRTSRLPVVFTVFSDAIDQHTPV